MTRREQVRVVQRTCNRFTTERLRGVKPLRVDGVKGPATNSRIMLVKFYVGYGRNRDARVTSQFIRRVRHPRSEKYSTKQMLHTAATRRRRQRNRWRLLRARAYVQPGVTHFDGVPVCKCAVPYLRYARANGWRGRLVSGWRSTSYTVRLCLNICGRPMCPGRCGGTSSNHVGTACPRFAIDVNDYARFGWLMRRMPNPPQGRRIYNALGAQDPVHYSPSGR